jgi:hypothetical protein
MANKTNAQRLALGRNSTKIGALEIRHFIDGVEVASLPEACMRLGIPTSRTDPEASYSNPTLNGIHARRDELLPKPYLYGSAYYYPVEELNKAINDYQATAKIKVARTDKLGKLLAKLKENPELVEMLSSLVD